MEEILEMLRQKEALELQMGLTPDPVSKDSYYTFRNQIFDKLLELRPNLVMRLKSSWCRRYNYIDPSDVESYIYESVLVAIEKFKPSKGKNFDAFLWNICGWSTKTLVIETLKRKEVALPEFVEIPVKYDQSVHLHQKMLVEKIHAEASEICKKIIDELSAGKDYTEIGDSLKELTGRKLFPSEVSYWIKSVRTQYQGLMLNA